jgi:hypothetical protein
MTTLVRSILLVGVVIACTQANADSDFYVISSTHKKQNEAQREAAANGGWVLITDFYSKLGADLFAVVRGPFRSQKSAEAELTTLKSMTKFKSSYVKEAGVINVAAGLKKFSPIVLATLLGEIRIGSKDREGAQDACEPQQPYSNVTLHYFTLMHDPSEKNPGGFIAHENAIEFGNLFQLKNSGEIQRMRICAE